MIELTTTKKLKWAMKKKQLQAAATRKVEQVSSWVEQNKELLIVALPTAAAITKGATNVTRSVIRRGAVRAEKRNKELYCYDRSLGHYWALKRPLSNTDWVKINDRKKNGEKLGDILSSMKVLK